MSKKISVMIVDDEAGIRQNLKHQLNLLDINFNLVAESENVTKAVNILQEIQPDVIFLDIEMPDGTGFDVLKQVDISKSKVIFITAHNIYAVQAFRFSALDYLLKPIDIEELESAMQKVEKEIEKEINQFKINNFLENIEEMSNKRKKIVLKNSDSIYAVSIADIVRLESSDNYTTFYFANNTKVIISKTLKEYEDMLDEYGFFRIHQSHLINLQYFQKYDKKDGGSIILKDNINLPLSSRKKESLLRILEQL